MLRNTLNTFITATFIMLLGVSSTAQAVVPANTRITSTTTLELSDGKTLIESVTVTVDLQRSKPEIALKEVTVDGVPLEGDLGDVQWLHGKTKTLTYKYTITAKANGPAKYAVDTTVTNAGLKQEAGKKVDCKNFSCQDFSLGATAALERAETGAKVITVPNAGEGEYQSPTMVNGLEKGDIIFVNGETYEVGKVTMGDQEQLTNKIWLVSPLLTDVAVGDLIAEQEEFTVLLRKVVLDAAAENNMSQEGITITVSQPDHADLEAIRNQDKFTVMEPRGPEIQIYVRNLSGEDGANPDPASEGLKTKTYPENGGNTYFSTHDEPRHSPGDILEYLVTVRAGNEEPLTDQEYQIPNTPFLDYEGDLRLNNDSQLATPFRPVTVLLANDVENSPNTVDIDTIAYITYQVTVSGGDGGGDGGDGGGDGGDGDESKVSGSGDGDKAAKQGKNKQKGKKAAREGENAIDTSGDEGASDEEGAQGGGESINDRFPPGTAWSVVVRAYPQPRDVLQQNNPEVNDLTACWCAADAMVLGSPCPQPSGPASWAVGPTVLRVAGGDGGRALVRYRASEEHTIPGAVATHNAAGQDDAHRHQFRCVSE